MSIIVQTLTRTFSFNGVNLPDPGPDFSPEEVKDMYVNMYPDLSTAVLSEPDITGDAVAYKFVRNVGTKG
jgi:PRTRC genetic system protein C